MTERRKLALQLNQPTEIELLYDEPVVGKSQYGDYYLYAVKNKDTEFAFFAPEEVHSELQDLKKGEKAVVTKLAVQKGNKLVTKYVVGNNNVSGKEEKTAQKHTNSNNVYRIDESNDEDSSHAADKYYTIMLQSYKDAIRIQEEVGFVDMSNVIRIAITLFIQRSR